MHPTIERLKQFKEEHAIPNIQIALSVKVREVTIYNWFGNSHDPSSEHIQAIEKFIDKYEKEVKAKYEIKLRKIRARTLAYLHNGLAETFKAFRRYGSHGVIHKILSLEDISRDEKLYVNDPAIPTAIEELCRQGKIKIWGMTMSRSMRSDNITFRVEIGTGKLFPPNPRVQATRLYRDEPLNSDELKGEEVLLNITQLVERLRQRKKAAFAATRGASGERMRAKLHREDCEAEAAARRAAERAAEGIEKLVNKEVKK